MARKTLTPSYEVSLALKDKGAHDEALQVARRALTVPQDDRVAAQLNNLICWLLTHRVRRHGWEAVWCGERAAVLARSAGDRQLAIDCLLNYGASLCYIGRFEQAAAVFQELLDMEAGAADRAAVHANLAWLHLVGGNFETALAALDAAEALARGLSMPLLDGILVRRGSVLMALGKLHEAGLALQEAAEQAVGDQGSESPLNFLHRLTHYQSASPYTYGQGVVVLVAFARLNFLQQDLARAHKIITDVTSLTEEKCDYPVLAECYALRALLYQAEGDLTPALLYAQRATQAAVQSGRMDIKALLRRDLTTLLQGGDLW